MITLANGSTFFLNNLVSIVTFGVFVFYFCIMINRKKYDKALHVFISTAATILLIWILGLFTYWWIAPCVVFLAGVGKEIADKLNPKKKLFDWWDLLADLIGVGWVTVFYLFSFVLWK